MQVEQGMRRTAVRALVALLSVALVFTMMPLTGGAASHAAEGGLQTQTPAVVVSGQGLTGAAYTKDTVKNEVSYTLDELKAMDGVTGEMYSSRKQQEPFARSYFIADGVKVSALLGDAVSGTEEIAFLASDGYRCSFKKGAAYVNPSTEQAIGLDGGRYYYDGFTETPTKEVPAILSWAYEDEKGYQDQPPEKKPAAVKDVGKLRLLVGQMSKEAGGDGADDMNQPLYNGNEKEGINRILVGDAVTEKVLTVGSEEYTRADVLLMGFAENVYSYETSKGPATDYVRGVPMSALLDGYGENDIVTFETVDNYPVAASGYTVKQLIENDYMLGYEMGASAAEMTGLYDADKNDASIYGFFRLYGSDENGKPAKFVNKISITSAGGIDFSKSSYKHITNGGITGQDSPYNIDAITGATMTVEGPGTVTSVPLSIKDMENQNAGCYRGNYTDVRGGKDTDRTYEGVELYHLLHNMEKGDNGIKLTEGAYRVKIKNRNRQTIAQLTLEQIDQMHADGDPAIVAYGTSYTDGTNIRPFVFDRATGANAELGNEDGCVKFVYDFKKYGGNESYRTFGNMAYIYVEEEAAPGYKHDKEPYDTAENSQYVLTVTGEEIGREVNFKVEDLEKLVEYDTDGKVKDNGYGWRDEYSLANSSYWYVNEYEGVKLWSLLLHAGVDPAKASDADTKVTFRSTDNYGAFDVFSLKQVADPDSFGFYEKNANDNNDGTYVPNENIRTGDDVTTGDKLSVGYPVLVAYGVNQYPYVIHKDLKGYLSGLSNDGGPLRIISGKMNYNHANGSNQAKLLDKIVVGEDKYHYSTHTYQSGADYTALKDNELKVTINNGTKTNEKAYTIEDLETLIYGGTLTQTQLKEAKVKAFYEVAKNGNVYSDLYEGVNLNYFLRDVVKLQGSQGTITFRSGEKELILPLEDVLDLNNGYNAETKLSGLSPIIAYAKNGYPLVAEKSSAGYVGEGDLSVVSGEASEATKYTVQNNGGPLQIIFPRSSKEAESPVGKLDNVTEVVIDLEPDKYAHTAAPYDALGDSLLTIGGEGTRLTEDKKFAVADLEGRQSIITTKDYSIRNDSGNVSQLRYRGLSLYQLLRSTDVGLKTNADKVLVYCSDDPEKAYEFSLSDIMKNDYVNTVTGAKDLPVMLAFGSAPAGGEDAKAGLPLVKEKTDEGYVAEYGNSGGPLKLVVGQKSAEDVNSKLVLKDVVRIEVTAGEQKSWNHSSLEVFKTYLDNTLELKVIDKDGKELAKKTRTVAELEAMTSLIDQQEIYAVKSNVWEGLNFWQLLQQEFKDVAGIKDPITITVKAKDGYSVDAVEKAGLDGLKNGVKDGDKYVPILLAYAVDGLPLSSGGKNDTPGVGYDSTVDNKGGPFRLMVHNAQGACIMEVVSVTIKVGDGGGSDPVEKADFTITGIDGGAVNIEDLKKLPIHEKEYTYKGGPVVNPEKGTTEKARGVYLADVLASMGVTDEEAVFSIDAGGYEGEGTYLNISLQEAMDQNYMIAFEVYNEKSGAWESFEDTSKDDATLKSKVRIYRDYTENHPEADQTKWYNKCTAITGITIKVPKRTVFKTYEGTSQPGELPLAGIRCTVMDKDGNLWIGTYGGGASFLAKDSDKFVTYNTASDPALETAFVSALYPDANGGVWMTQNASYSDPTANRGVVYLKDGKLTSYRAPDTVPDDYVQEVKVDAQGNVWFGSAKGLTKYDPKQDKWQTWGEEAGFPAASIDNIELDGNGGIWCGFYPNTNADGSYTGGFAYFKDGKVVKSYQYTAEKDSKTPNYRLGDVWVRDIAVDKNGAAWVVASGSTSGMANVGGTVWYVSKPGAEAKKYTGYDLIGKDLLDGADNSELRMVTVDPDGGLWFSSSADGIFYVKDPVIKDGKLAVTEQFASTTKSWPKSPSYDNVYSLDFHGNTLYAGSSAGLAVHEFAFAGPVKPVVNPLKNKKPVLRTIKPGKKKATLRWKKVKGAKGYVIYRATKKNGHYKRIKTIKNGKTTKFTNKKLKKGKRYYYKIKAYTKIKGKPYYSKYSKVRKVRIRR